MQLEVKYQELKPIESNFESLKVELKTQLEKYQNLIVIETEIPKYKEDRATLNKLKTAIDNERKRIKKEYNEPVSIFENQVKELISMIDEPISCLDSQLKKFDEENKKRKLEEIKIHFNQINNIEQLRFEHFFKEKWLNSSVSIKNIKEQLEFELQNKEKEIDTIKESYEKEYLEELLSTYFKNLNMVDVVYDYNNIKNREALVKQKIEKEKEKENEKDEAMIVKVKKEQKIIEYEYKLFLTEDKKNDLEKYMNLSDIKFEVLF